MVETLTVTSLHTGEEFESISYFYFIGNRFHATPHIVSLTALSRYDKSFICALFSFIC